MSEYDNISLDDIMKAPTDESQLMAHLVSNGYVQPPAPPVAPAPTISPAEVAPMTPVVPKSDVAAMTPPATDKARAELAPLAASEAAKPEVAPMIAPSAFYPAGIPRTGRDLALHTDAYTSMPTGVPTPKIGEMGVPEVMAGEPAGTTPAAIAPMEKPSIEGAAVTNKEERQSKLAQLRPQITAPVNSEAYWNQKIAQQEFDKQHPWGSELNHPGFAGKLGHILATAGNIAGTVVAPGTMALIPGTSMNQRLEEIRNIERAKEAGESEEKEKTGALQRENLASEIKTREAANKQNLVQDAQGNPVGWKDNTGALHSLEEPGTPAAIKQIAEASEGKTKPEMDQPLDISAADADKQLQDRWQVLHPGKPLPDEYKVGTNPTKGKFARIDKALSAVENAEATNTQRQQLLELKKQTLAMQNQKKTTSDQAIESAAQSLARGGINDLTSLKDIASLRGDERLRIFQRAKELNPNFNTSDINRKIKMMDDFTNGSEGKQLQSFGTFLEHAGAAADFLGKVGLSDKKIFNKPLSWWKQNISSDPRYTAYLAALEPVRKEFEGFLLGGRALYGDDRAAAEKILSDTSTPAQVADALKQMGHTVQARYNEMDHRFQNQMKVPISQGIGDLSDEAKQGAKKIGVTVGAAPPPTAGAGGATPTPPAGKVTVLDPKGQPHFVNSNAVDDFLKDPKYQGWKRSGGG